MTSPWNRQGFTLLETIISITLIALTVGIVAGAVNLSNKSVASGDRKMESLERLRRSLYILDSQVRSATPLTFTENGATRFYFRGERDNLRFATNYSIWGGQKGYVIVTYHVGPGNGGKQALYASECTVGMENRRETLLLEGVDSVDFEYFHQAPAAATGKWIPSWPEESFVPVKIRVHIVNGSTDLSYIMYFRARAL